MTKHDIYVTAMDCLESVMLNWSEQDANQNRNTLGRVSGILLLANSLIAYYDTGQIVKELKQ